MTYTAETTNRALWIAVDWPSIDSWGVRGLLTCGHYSEVCGWASSTWEFHWEEQVCSECHKEVQFDLLLQAKLSAGEEIDTLDLRVGN